MMDRDRGQVKRILILQGVSAIILSIGAGTWGLWVGWSAGIGAAIALMTNGVFAAQLFRPYRADALPALARQIYGAAVRKMILALLLFGSVFSTAERLSIPVLILAYGVVQLFPPMLVSFWKSER